MADLSPAAQAVLDGFRAVPSLMHGPSIAGALRAAVEIYLEEGNGEGPQWFLAIASDLEGVND